MDLTDIYRTLHPKKPRIHIFSSAHVTFSRTNHVLGDKTSLNKFKRTEITSSIFCDHNGMKLEVNHRKENRKRMNPWRLNNMLLKNQWVNDKIKEDIRKYLETKKK